MLFQKANQLLFLLNWKLPGTKTLLYRLSTEALCRSFSMSYPSSNLRLVQNTSVIFSVSKQKFDWGQRACRSHNQGRLDLHNPWLVTFVPLKSNGETHKIMQKLSLIVKPGYFNSSAQVPSSECFNILVLKNPLGLKSLHNNKESQDKVHLHISTRSLGTTFNISPGQMCIWDLSFFPLAHTFDMQRTA